MKLLLYVFLFTPVFSCKRNNEVDSSKENYVCKTVPKQNNFNRIQLIQKFDNSIIQGLASGNTPNSSGALGRNKTAYFHVRFQMGLNTMADYAVYSQQTTALEYAINSIEYSFQNQLSNGNFRLVIPTGTSGPAPTIVDSASGVAFFLSSLGSALNTFQQSSWYNSPSISLYKNRVEILRPKIQLAVNWLVAQKTVLELGDQNAPNRLFFNALAYYSLGKWLNDISVKNIGLQFAQLAISKKNVAGYFLEDNGWDSSYQGVNLNIGFNLYSLLDDTEPIKSILWDCLSCATDWQKSRVLNNGEISTKNNTRVYPGGELFLGQEKQVDWIDTMLGFFMMSYFSADNEYNLQAQKVKNHYD